MTCLCAEATLGWLVLEQVYLTRHRHSDAYVPIGSAQPCVGTRLRAQVSAEQLRVGGGGLGYV